MPRARNKEQLLTFGNTEYEKLMDRIHILSKEQCIEKPVFENRTVKDVIAHLHAWHELFFIWYNEGMAGEKPEIPASGYTLKTTPELNEKLYQDYKNTSWEEVVKKFKKSHKHIIALIEKHTDSELEEKKKYAWTGSTNLASYFASATSSHYQWASDVVKKAVLINERHK